MLQNISNTITEIIFYNVFEPCGEKKFPFVWSTFRNLDCTFIGWLFRDLVKHYGSKETPINIIVVQCVYVLAVIAAK